MRQYCQAVENNKLTATYLQLLRVELEKIVEARALAERADLYTLVGAG